MKGPDDNDRLIAGELGSDPAEGCEEIQGADGGTEPAPGVCELLTWRWKDGERIAPVKSLRNTFLIIQHDPRWRRRLRLNSFSGRFEIDGRPIRDEDETAAAIWIDEVYGMQAPVGWAGEAMRLSASASAHHPVRAYLDGLVWDGVERLPAMLATYWGADSAPLTGAVGVAWMIGCVARVRRPGCQMDNTLVLVGPQGAGKSSSIRYGLVPEPAFFDDGRLDFGGDKDSMQRVAGRWIYEIPELISTRKREVEDVKAFLTRTIDSYRPPYGRNVIDQPRQVVFIGTTNEDAFLRDPTGSRRFWAVRVSRADVVGLRRDRDQLWAEAQARYARGEQWWLPDELEAGVAEANRSYEEEDPWAEMIARAVAEMVPLSTFSVGDVLDKMQIPAHQRGRGHDNRVSQVLKDLGCEKAGRGPAKAGKPRLWRRPAAD
jgi:putative DNA primase/helicase